MVSLQQNKTFPLVSNDQALLLRVLLERDDHPEIKLMDFERAGKVLTKLSRKEALRMVRSEAYAWIGSAKRIYKIRPVRKAALWVECYRTTAAATLPPSIEYLDSLR